MADLWQEIMRIESTADEAIEIEDGDDDCDILEDGYVPPPEEMMSLPSPTPQPPLLPDGPVLFASNVINSDIFTQSNLPPLGPVGMKWNQYQRNEYLRQECIRLNKVVGVAAQESCNLDMELTKLESEVGRLRNLAELEKQAYNVISDQDLRRLARVTEKTFYEMTREKKSLQESRESLQSDNCSINMMVQQLVDELGETKRQIKLFHECVVALPDNHVEFQGCQAEGERIQQDDDNDDDIDEDELDGSMEFLAVPDDILREFEEAYQEEDRDIVQVMEHGDISGGIDNVPEPVEPPVAVHGAAIEMASLEPAPGVSTATVTISAEDENNEDQINDSNSDDDFTLPPESVLDRATPPVPGQSPLDEEGQDSGTSDRLVNSDENHSQDSLFGSEDSFILTYQGPPSVQNRPFIPLSQRPGEQLEVADPSNAQNTNPLDARPTVSDSVSASGENLFDGPIPSDHLAPSDISDEEPSHLTISSDGVISIYVILPKFMDSNQNPITSPLVESGRLEVSMLPRRAETANRKGNLQTGSDNEVFNKKVPRESDNHDADVPVDHRSKSMPGVFMPAAGATIELEIENSISSTSGSNMSEKDDSKIIDEKEAASSKFCAKCMCSCS